jgi:hypothetical protein
MIGELAPDGDNDPADAVVEVAAGPAVTRPGDIWRIGSHRLICGDSTRSETYQERRHIEQRMTCEDFLLPRRRFLL